MARTPLDAWIAGKTGDLARWQQQQLRETLRQAQHSPYYRAALPSWETATALGDLPTMTSETLVEQGMRLLCVRPREISRIVSLCTSGSTGHPKRVYFTEQDLELTIDFFAHGLTTMVRARQAMAVCLPCAATDGVGDLICRALRRIPVEPVPYGLIENLEDAARMLVSTQAQAAVGIPVQLVSLARFCARRGIRTNLRKVLLSTDYVPRAIIRQLRGLWGCEVYEHYGMTEMGLGGGVDCDAHAGCHVRENDLLIEIIDAQGHPVPDGHRGEIVFTTLTRRGMPLIRYRTGDRSAILPGNCPCGSPLRRLAPVQGRIDGALVTRNGTTIRLPEWDEVLFQADLIGDYRLLATPSLDQLTIAVETQRGWGTAASVERQVRALLAGFRPAQALRCDIRVAAQDNQLKLHHGNKRTVISTEPPTRFRPVSAWPR
jgi:phenylacetate-coenzyme A ligase PaaK-like adenylate-forming protein